MPLSVHRQERFRSDIKRRLPELIEIERVMDKLARSPAARQIETIAEVELSTRRLKHRLPVHAITLGSADPQVPVVAFFGGVHGLEKIGSQLCTAFMQTVAQLLEWDQQIHDFLNQARLVFIPLVNPGGMFLNRRANPQGVDLMRNAPIDADQLAKFSLLSGHRLSSHLPWYRGALGEAMQVEAEAVVHFVERNLFSAKTLITLDIHSGFGVRDRLWFPYAKTAKPFPNLAEMYALVDLLESTFPYNVYKIEPQAKSYTTHGDLWDYLYDRHRNSEPTKNNLYLPLCLELGSWIWVKKNPKQLLSLMGIFNPMVPHRQQRTMRRHLVLFDFLCRASLAYASWAFPDAKKRQRLDIDARDIWYPHL